MRRTRWESDMSELLYVYTLCKYSHTPESLARDFPRDKVQAMLGVYEELSKVKRTTVAEYLLYGMNLPGDVIEKGGELFVIDAAGGEPG